MAAPPLARAAFMVVCLLATALGLNNTYGDDTAVKALAEKTACGSARCSVKILSESRSALQQSFSYQTSLVEKGKSAQNASADVVCKRVAYLLGEYQCALSSGGLPEAAH